LVTGVLLGAIFFGGLWWTVRQGVFRPDSLRFGSSAACYCGMSIVLAGFILSRTVMGAAAAMSSWICHGTPRRDVADAAIERKPTFASLESSHAP